MRGIAGLLHFDGRSAEPVRIGNLLRALAPGTFDRSTHACVGGAGFGHVLRISAPEDRCEAQPLRSADGNLLLVTDALLDNRAELAAAFGWSQPEANRRPDSAFVLAAYEKWGHACPARLDGRWAFAVWHVRERRLFAAVDHFSFRPFYYVQQDGGLAFASTLRGLLSLPGTSREIHDGVLADHLLRIRSHPGQTLYRQIHSLPAAHCLHADAAHLAVERYWRANPQLELRLGSDAEYLAAFRAEFEQAVSASLRVEGEIGIMVSGGLDSAAVTAVAGRLLAAQGRRLQAIHRLPPDGGLRRSPGRELDESRFVRRMQAHMPHVDFHFLPPAGQDSRISFAQWDAAMDLDRVPLRGAVFEKTEPAESPLHRLPIHRMLTGHGGNYAVSLEAYPSDYFLQLATRLQWSRLARELRGHAQFYHRTIRHLVKYRLITPLFPFRAPAHDGRIALLHCLNPDFVQRTDMVARLQRPRFLRWQRADFDVKRRMAWTLDELMPQNVGIAGSVIGADARRDNAAPLMTRRLNEFCLSVPLAQQIRDGRDRLLLRRAMKDLLPDDVIWRTSRGFDAPDSWAVMRQLLAILPAALEELAASSLAARYVDLAALRRHFADRRQNAPHRIENTRLLDLFSLAWFLRWLERAG
jgi:asparagine synthase (glutamine-hydrolysing)